ncbi:DCC1-like thiol-disulfide oxidoreductase family protein [Haladaptatus sp. CMAA 1911]|uniref:DCC1-like thiol-disulfide oxidoreductase family protein n=1 Tax=unclassified Haladaptatus TaxID=2622732 RepID=UPI0037544C36
MPDETLIYDDGCGFCTWWAEFFGDRSDIRIVGFSDLSKDERSRLPDDYEECAHLVTDGGRYSCGAAMEQTFVRSKFGTSVHPLVSFLRNFEEYSGIREDVYREIAERRDTLATVLSKEPAASDVREGHD